MTYVLVMPLKKIDTRLSNSKTDLYNSTFIVFLTIRNFVVASLLSKIE